MMMMLEDIADTSLNMKVDKVLLKEIVRYRTSSG